MLLFLPTFAPLPPDGLRAEAEPFRLTRTLAEAEAAARAPGGARGRVLVLDGARLDLRDDGRAAHVVPRRAVLNVDADGDYWPPEPVAAGGGYVVRRQRDGDGVDLLLIFRRGTWDLPKGKLDDGESVRQAAHREVAEEVGIDRDDVTVLRDLGTTLHGYVWPKREVYAVKTTAWYAMTTTAKSFQPEEREGIEAVAWVPWDEAGRRLGFDTLRDHHAGLDPDALGL